MIDVRIGERVKQHYSNTNTKQRKERKDKKIRVNCPIDQESHDLLKRLALACNITKTQLMAEITEIMLRSPQFLDWFQTMKKADKYRVIPVKENGKITY
jgi:hypothetical protein